MTVTDIFRHLPTLETERLVLRQVRLSDAAEMFAYYSDPAVADLTSWEVYGSVWQVQSYLKYIIDCYGDALPAPWAMVLKDGGQVIGMCGFATWIQQHARAELTYELTRLYWNRGYMTEAVRRAIVFGFETLEVNRIEGRCMLHNPASARVMEKAGMTFEGILREHLYAKGRFFDLKMYSILLREWRAGQER